MGVLRTEGDGVQSVARETLCIDSCGNGEDEDEDTNSALRPQHRRATDEALQSLEEVDDEVEDASLRRIKSSSERGGQLGMRRKEGGGLWF